MIKSVAILTSGGDAPGMNALIRAIVKKTVNNQITPFVVEEGYLGLYNNKIRKISEEEIEEITNQPGSFIYSARFPEFAKDEFKKQAIKNLNNLEIDALIVIGGDGTFKGAKRLSELGIKTIGISGTIDNGLAFHDYSLGFLTALETIVEAVEKIRDTSKSHNRIGIIQIMGRDHGDLTLYAGLATNADIISIPERKLSEEEIIKELKKIKETGKRGVIFLFTEYLYDINKLAKKVQESINLETNPTVLGYIQRGGSPSGIERVNASLLANFAVDQLLNDQSGIIVSIFENKLVASEISKVVDAELKISQVLLKTYDETK